MSDYRLMFDRNYIGHLDLAGKDVTLTISKVVGGELIAEGGRKSRKPIVHFAGDVKPMICNKTNAKTLAALYGNETAKWASKRVTLFTSMTRNPDGGSQVECVRIRPKVPGSGADTQIARQPDPEEHIEATSPAPKAAPAQSPQAERPGPEIPLSQLATSAQDAASFTDAQLIAQIASHVGKSEWDDARDIARSLKSAVNMRNALQAIGERESTEAIP